MTKFYKKKNWSIDFFFNLHHSRKLYDQFLLYVPDETFDSVALPEIRGYR